MLSVRAIRIGLIELKTAGVFFEPSVGPGSGESRLGGNQIEGAPGMMLAVAGRGNHVDYVGERITGREPAADNPALETNRSKSGVGDKINRVSGRRLGHLHKGPPGCRGHVDAVFFESVLLGKRHQLRRLGESQSNPACGHTTAQ